MGCPARWPWVSEELESVRSVARATTQRRNVFILADIASLRRCARIFIQVFLQILSVGLGVEVDVGDSSTAALEQVLRPGGALDRRPNCDR
mgnify:CR=1 FL=1